LQSTQAILIDLREQRPDWDGMKHPARTAPRAAVSKWLAEFRD
jgi:hypothetical protein